MKIRLESSVRSSKLRLSKELDCILQCRTWSFLMTCTNSQWNGSKAFSTKHLTLMSQDLNMRKKSPKLMVARVTSLRRLKIAEGLHKVESRIIKTWPKSRSLNSLRNEQRCLKTNLERYSIEMYAWACSSTISYCLHSSYLSRSMRKTNRSRKAWKDFSSFQFRKGAKNSTSQEWPWISQNLTTRVEFRTTRVTFRSPRQTNRVAQSRSPRRGHRCLASASVEVQHCKAGRTTLTNWPQWMKRGNSSRKRKSASLSLTKHCWSTLWLAWWWQMQSLTLSSRIQDPTYSRKRNGLSCTRSLHSLATRLFSKTLSKTLTCGKSSWNVRSMRWHSSSFQSPISHSYRTFLGSHSFAAWNQSSQR